MSALVTLGEYASAGTLSTDRRARAGRTIERRIFIVVSFQGWVNRGAQHVNEFWPRTVRYGAKSLNRCNGALGEYARFARSAKDVVEVDVPSMDFIMIDGEGDPNTSTAFAQAVEALFAVAYAAKFTSRKALPQSTTVSCHWRRSGGPTTCRFSRRRTRQDGNGPP
jgi:hypothetical protein